MPTGWDKYPIGTKAHHYMGGHWIRTEHGWKWCTGDTFPTPGAGVSRIEWPEFSGPICTYCNDEIVEDDPVFDDDNRPFHHLCLCEGEPNREL